MRTHSFRKVVLTAAAWLTVASIASAHFVWIETSSDGDKLLVRSGFGEPDGWDPDLIGRIAQTKFHTRTAKGLKPLEIAIDAKEKEFRTTLNGERPTAIVATTDFGTIQFGTSPPSWLRYTAKNLIGDAKDWKDDKPTKDLRIELLAKREGDKVKLRALFLGKPLADAKIKATTPKGEVELTTDAKGQAEWPVGEPGNYGCYVGTTTEKPGELDGKKYDVLKDYTTLSFTITK